MIKDATDRDKKNQEKINVANNTKFEVKSIGKNAKEVDQGAGMFEEHLEDQQET